MANPTSAANPVMTDPGFLALAAHELRQPLAAALGSSLALSDPDRRSRLDEGDERILLDIIQRNLYRLDGLLGTIHAFGEISKGRVATDPVLVPLFEVLYDAAESFGPLQATMQIDVDCDRDLYISVDTSQMQQVLSNLLGNAKKFSPPGSHITLEGRKEKDRIVITVRDEGPGIDEAEREKVFDIGISSDHARGLGLGLYVCQAIVVAHEGRIWVDGEPGEGARFNISLPVPRSWVTRRPRVPQS